MVDNFELAKHFIVPDGIDKDLYWVVQIISRRKDNPDLETNSKCYKTFYIESMEDLDNLKDTIIKYCQEYKARAYFNPTAKSWKKTALQVLKEMAQAIADERYKNCKGLFDAVAPGYGNVGEKYWVLDVDSMDDDNLALTNVLIWLESNIKDHTYTDIFPTPHGSHILMRPFDLREFTQVFPNVEIKKNNPTILFVPEFNT